MAIEVGFEPVPTELHCPAPLLIAAELLITDIKLLGPEMLEALETGFAGCGGLFECLWNSAGLGIQDAFGWRVMGLDIAWGWWVAGGT